jgi:hypothetical protein
LKSVDLADKTPPDVILSVTAVDPATQTATSVTVKPGESQTLPAKADTDIIIFATAKDPGGIKALRIFNVGAPLKHMADGEALATPQTAYATVTVAAVMPALAGFTLGVFAEAQNFGAGDASETTVTGGLVVLPVSGSPQPTFTGSTGSTPITFKWEDGVKAYVSNGAPSPKAGATVVGIEPGNPFGTGIFVSLYRGSGNINGLDLRTDFVRMWQNGRANFFNGPWSSQPWYALVGNTRSKGFPDTFDVQLRWQ